MAATMREAGVERWGGGHESSFELVLTVPYLELGLEDKLVREAWAHRAGHEVAFGLRTGKVGRRRRKTKPSPKVPNGAGKLCTQS